MLDGLICPPAGISVLRPTLGWNIWREGKWRRDDDEWRTWHGRLGLPDFEGALCSAISAVGLGTRMIYICIGRIGWRMEGFEPKMQGDPRKKGPHAGRMSRKKSAPNGRHRERGWP